MTGTTLDPQVLRNPALASGEAAAAVPLISVLLPFYQFDCSALVARLSALAKAEPLAFELVLADDGSPDSGFVDAVWVALRAAVVPGTLLRFPRNQGRAGIRNQLAQAARGGYLLYLDSDMMPDEPDYLEKYAALARRNEVDIVYGGRSAKHADRGDPALQLHRVMTEMRESLPVSVRVQAPAYHFYSCNFMARRAVLEAIPLDEKFVGWGWEDCEWAARASEQFALLHIDNPASHLGLLRVERILDKYDESIGNFRRALELRPEMVKPITLYKIAVLIRRWHLGAPVKLVARQLALASWLPLRTRVGALAFYKAALYSTVV